MAGVKGRSGGARANTGGARANAGGARPGAGRKPKPKPAPVPMGNRDMLEVLQDVALGLVDATALQVRAAIAAVQYTHAKKANGGKKDEAASNAAKAAKGRFSPAAAPKLVSSR